MSGHSGITHDHFRDLLFLCNYLLLASADVHPFGPALVGPTALADSHLKAYFPLMDKGGIQILPGLAESDYGALMEPR